MIPIGQLVPSQSQSFNKESLIQLKDYCTRFNFQGRINIYVASENESKKRAALAAVKEWAKKYFTDPQLYVTSIATISDVNEQPFGENETKKGSNNRLLAIYQKCLPFTIPNQMNIFVAFENGVMEEKLPSINNREVFESQAGFAWVDRCYVSAAITFGLDYYCKFTSISKGVTVPYSCIRASIASGNKKTAGQFVSEQYDGVVHDNWHETLTGVSREKLMQEALLNALGG